MNEADATIKIAFVNWNGLDELFSCHVSASCSGHHEAILMMFPKSILYLLCIFNLFGFCVELEEARMSLKWIRVIFGIHTISSLFVCAYVRLFIQNAHTGLLTIANLLLKYCGVILVCWTIIIESYCKRPVQQKFWRIYHHLEDNFNCSSHTMALRSFLMKFSLFFVISAAIYIKHSIYLFQQSMGTSLYLSYSYVSEMILQDMRVFYFLFVVHLLSYQLQSVESEMISIADASENRIVSRSRLRRVRIFHDLVCDLSNCTNEVFGWSSVAIILYQFSRLAADLNRIYWESHHGVETDSKRKPFPLHGVTAIMDSESLQILQRSSRWWFRSYSYSMRALNALKRCRSSVLFWKNLIGSSLIPVPEYHFPYESHRNRFGWRRVFRASWMRITANNASAGCFACQRMFRYRLHHVDEGWSDYHTSSRYIANYVVLRLQLLGGITTYLMFYIQFSSKFE